MTTGKTDLPELTGNWANILDNFIPQYRASFSATLCKSTAYLAQLVEQMSNYLKCLLNSINWNVFGQSTWEVCIAGKAGVCDRIGIGQLPSPPKPLLRLLRPR